MVRNDASHSDILFQTSDETWQAYNTYGGNSLYTCTINCPPGSPEAYKGAAKVSYNRPWHSGADDNGASWFMYAEYPMIRFLEENGYDVSYTSGVDMSQPGAASIIEQHKIFMSTGHDEYWSGQQRANVTAARDAGVNLAFFSGNEVFWKTRWEPSIDGSNTAEPDAGDLQGDALTTLPPIPQDPPTWTGTWMDPRFSPPADGGQPAERADRAAVRRQLRHHRHHRAVSVQQAPVLAQYPRGQPVLRPVHHAGCRRRHPRL